MDMESSKARVLIVGPSGVGKTRLLEQLALNGTRTVDLDVVGYRTDRSDWKQWIIPASIINVLSVGPRVVAAAASSNIDEVILRAIELQWRVHFKLGTAKQIAANREARGDSKEKVLDAPVSHALWLKRAKDYADLHPNEVTYL